MTPDLKIACEVVFQEHKLSAQPIKWGRDAFRGRISFGLSEMAKETLVKKKIILVPDKSKKVFTQLNPEVAAAGSFEEAEKMVGTKMPGPLIAPTYNASVYTAAHIIGFDTAPVPTRSPKPPHVTGTSGTMGPGIKWYLKPLFLYVVWPVCGAVGGILISLLMTLATTELF